NGQAFCRHQDGAHATDGMVSRYTLQVYLNDASEFSGGNTRFFAGRAGAMVHSVPPERGTAIVFDHLLWHDGEAVHAGTKYVLRTDVMFESGERNGGYLWKLARSPDGGVVAASRRGFVSRWAFD